VLHHVHVTEQACPGSCNYRYREAMAAWQQAMAGYDPLNPHQSRPGPPEIRPVTGTPWCPRCQAILRRELAELDYLASLLNAAADGQRGQRPGAKMPKGKNHGGPSPSPTADLLEELAGDLREWESTVRGHQPLARRGHLATETTMMITWLTGQFDKAIIMPFAVKFGEGIQAWHRRLNHLAKAGTGTHHRAVRCPRCSEMAVWWTEGDDHAICHGKGNTCGRLIGLDELDELAAAQDKARTEAAGTVAGQPAA
jgi:hypothetical protein